MNQANHKQQNMRRDFANRSDLIDYLKAQFPEASATEPPATQATGGRKAAEATLQAIKPASYAKTRNNLDGAVTGLSSYIRHGVLSLAEVRDAALAKANTKAEAEKLVAELGWRDYFQRLYNEIGGDRSRDPPGGPLP